MKNIIIYSILTLNIVLLFLFWRVQRVRADYLEKKIERLENQIGSLKENPISVELFKKFEHILLNELKNPPSVSIEAYQELINLHKNTYWAHEAKKRIQNIKARSVYWSKEKGWNLPPMDTTTMEFREPVIISCPGC